jgi:hypothetical protein
MDGLGKIDIAFLPMNLPYTMSVSMAADAAKKIRPAVLYIYHFGSSDTASRRNLPSGQPMAVRIGPSLFYMVDGSQATTAVQRGRATEMIGHPGNGALRLSSPSPDADPSPMDLKGRSLRERRPDGMTISRRKNAARMRRRLFMFP